MQYSDLVFKNGDFIEYNAHPGKYSIEKIEYQTTFCFGTCPVFYMSVLGDKSATFKAESYNRRVGNSREIKGVFHTTISDTAFFDIINLLDYIDFPNLEDNYSVGRTDDQTSVLTVTYNNGKVKTIRDYGLVGTFGLDRLYHLFFNLRYNQNWK